MNAFKSLNAVFNAEDGTFSMGNGKLYVQPLIATLISNVDFTWAVVVVVSTVRWIGEYHRHDICH